MLWTCWNRAVPANLRRMFACVLQERLSPADTSLIPQDNFCKDMSLHWRIRFSFVQAPLGEQI